MSYENDVRNSNPDPYSFSNPPPSETAALSRISELEQREHVLLAQLEQADPSYFGSTEDFQSWKRRTTGALGYTRAERQFLARWLNGERTPKVERVAETRGRSKQNKSAGKQHAQRDQNLPIEEFNLQQCRDYLQKTISTGDTIGRNLISEKEALLDLLRAASHLMGGAAEQKRNEAEHLVIILMDSAFARVTHQDLLIYEVELYVSRKGEERRIVRSVWIPEGISAEQYCEAHFSAQPDFLRCEISGPIAQEEFERKRSERQTTRAT